MSFPALPTDQPDAPRSIPTDQTIKPKGIGKFKNKNVITAAVAAAALIAIGVWFLLRPVGPGVGFISGNGRIEAIEIDVATKLAGRVVSIAVDEGDFVHAGQTLAQMQIDVLDAQLNEAKALSQQSVNSVVTADDQTVARKSDKTAAEALVAQRESELDTAQRRLARSKSLNKKGFMTDQDFEIYGGSVREKKAALSAAKAQVASAEAAIDAAQAAAEGARSAEKATEATTAKTQADITDSQLISPREARVQYRVVQPGEVLAAGGKVLNLVDLSDVYMTFFLPETVVGKVALGSDVHLVLDAAPKLVIPAKVSYVASVAQFTPKTVETASERQKLMFRVKARIDRELLQKHLKQIKTGLPGMAWLKLDPKAKWPPNLELKVTE